MFNKENINTLNEIIKKNDRIIVCSHKAPDGDAIGSMLAIYHFLTEKFHNKIIHLILPDNYPEYLSFLPNIEKVINYCNDELSINEAFNTAQVIFAVDFNEPNRLGFMENLFKNSNAAKILIDHHPINDNSIYNLIFSDEKASSAAELVYFVLSSLDKQIINYEIALSLYVGIITDTGSLSFNCNMPRTYSVMADLMKYNIDARAIHDLIYNNFPPDRTRLLAYVLNDKLVINEEKKYAYYSLNKDELIKFNYKDGYLEGVVNCALNIRGIEIAAAFVERHDVVKISFRSKGDIYVNKIAKTYFNGGGHKNAAGADWNDSIENAIKLFIEVI